MTMKTKQKAAVTVTLSKAEAAELLRAVDYAMAMEMDIADKRGPLTRWPLTKRHTVLDGISAKLRSAQA